jgi:D-methionine transport system permease protein
MFDPKTIEMLIKGIGETFYMVFASSAAAYIIGLPLGITLVVTDKKGIWPLPILNKVLGFIINILRSVPFIILLIAVTPITRMIAGQAYGPTATVIPLIIASAPYIARLVESSIKEVPEGIIEAAKAMGASTFQIIWKVYIPEAIPSLLVGSAIAITTIIGYSAMAGFTGGGGLGTIAINYGQYRYQTDVMMVTVAILVIIVQAIQEIGLKLATKKDKRIS